MKGEEILGLFFSAMWPVGLLGAWTYLIVWKAFVVLRTGIWFPLTLGVILTYFRKYPVFNEWAGVQQIFDRCAGFSVLALLFVLGCVFAFGNHALIQEARQKQ
jgi:hypothetical protein